MSKAVLIFEDLERSVVFLANAAKQPEDAYMRAAVIQAFEICFELSWKYLQARLTTAGIVGANSPRSVFRESAKVGLLNQVEAWLVFAEQRNLTTHTYQEQLADEVYAMIKSDFLPAAQALIDNSPPDKEV